MPTLFDSAKRQEEKLKIVDVSSIDKIAYKNLVNIIEDCKSLSLISSDINFSISDEDNIDIRGLSKISNNIFEISENVDSSSSILQETIVSLMNSHKNLESLISFWMQKAEYFSDRIDKISNELEYTKIIMNGWNDSWMSWCYKNITGKWTVLAGDDIALFLFENSNDATYFKLSVEINEK